MQALDGDFNHAVMVLAKTCWPRGFDITQEQYPSFEAMREDFRIRARISVNTLFSEQTIFGDSGINWQFRAWHDYCHLKGNWGFDSFGEFNAAYLQIQMLREKFPNHPKLPLWEALIDIEVNSQLGYYLHYGSFVENQFEFAVQCLKKRGF